MRFFILILLVGLRLVQGTSIIQQLQHIYNNVPEQGTAINKRTIGSVMTLLKHKSDQKLLRNSQFSDESVSKAFRVLNDMMEKRFGELDDELLQNKGSINKNRARYDQTTRDISRLEQEKTDAEREQAEAEEQITRTSDSHLVVTNELQDETAAYNKVLKGNGAELKRRINDVAPWEFLGVSALTEELGSSSSIPRKGEGHLERFSFMKKGGDFYDQVDELQDQMKQNEEDFNSTKEDLIRQISHLQAEMDSANNELVETTAQINSKKEEIEAKTDYKNSLDENYKIIASAEKVLKSTITTSLPFVSTSKSSTLKGRRLLVECKGRDDYPHTHTVVCSYFKQHRNECHPDEFKACHECDKCSKPAPSPSPPPPSPSPSTFPEYHLKKIRDALVIKHHKVEPIDCKVGVWVPGECSVACDDNCDYDDSDKVCGGWQTLTREVVTPPNNKYGVKCPSLSKLIRCNQIKCSVDCLLIEWSEWSKCTADCDGGVQTHTRSVLTKPVNGGMACDTLEESEPCNSMSCDRDCTLDSWTPWTPCSMACGRGFQEKFRHVETPASGYGKCPKEESSIRYEKQSCNDRQCVGDEVCIAKQDIFVYVDSSAKSKILTKAYQELFDGDNAAFKNSVIQGGYWLENGKLKLGFPETNNDGSWNDLYPIGKDVETRLRLDGGYRIARAANASEAWLSKNGRAGAVSKFIIIADIKAIDSLFVLRKTLNKMKENGIYVQAMVWGEGGSNEKPWKSFVSESWETNIVFVPLGSNTGTIRQSVIAKFCPLAASPQSA